MTTQASAPAQHADDEHERLTAMQGLAALSLDALSSVAYGPEAILVVLVAAGSAGLGYTMPVTGAIIVLLTALVISYRQVIAAFPSGGGAYAVSKAHLGRTPSLVAAASLIVDYVLNAAVGVSAGIAAVTSAFPSLYPSRVWLCLAALAIITGLNLWGISESAKAFTVPTVAFIVAIAAVIIVGLFRAHPTMPLDHHLGASTEAVGILLVLKAFASGCSALTGVEAIANAVPQFRKPRERRAQHTEVWLGVLLGSMLIGLGILIRKFDVVPRTNITVLAQLTEASLGHNVIFYAIQLITMVLLALAANTSFAGLPVLASLLAKDNFLPHMFALRADRQVHRYGVVVLAILAAALLVAAKGDTQALVPLFAVGVFVGFTLSQLGMVRHWLAERSGRRVSKALINGTGAVLTAATTVIELVSKFTEGAWLIVLVIPGLVLLFDRINSSYARIGALLEIGKIPERPEKKQSLVIVPVGGLSRLTAEGLSAALSLGDEVVAVTVCYADPDDVAADVSFRDQWDDWHPDVELITLRSMHRSLAKPVVKYLCGLEQTDKYHRLVVLIPEVQPSSPWQYLLHNQRGVILDRAIRHGTVNVVLCRLRYRLDAIAPPKSNPGRLQCARLRNRHVFWPALRPAGGKIARMIVDLPVAVVTGGNRGIGREVCRQLALLGFVVVLGSRDLRKGELAAKELDPEQGRIFACHLEVDNSLSVAAAAEWIKERFGRADVLINNASTPYDRWVTASTADLGMVAEAIDVNLFGPWRVIQSLLPLLRSGPRPRIVNVSSEEASIATMTGGGPAFSSSKASLNALTRLLAGELGRDGILVNAVCPGHPADAAHPGGRTLGQAAASIIWAVTLPNGGPTGTFTRDGQPFPW
jgi:NAD(P)-dependent dehydrogenase (short-subunit alcohol dehydrogenase family)/amino acid transporter